MKKIFGVLMLCILLIGTSAQATKTWVSGNTGSWNTASNWGGTLPSSGETAQVNNGTCNIDAPIATVPGILLMGNASTDVGVINVTSSANFYKSGSAGIIEMIKAGSSAGGSATINVQTGGSLRVGAAGTANGGTSEMRLVTSASMLGTATINLSGSGVIDADVLSKGNKTNTAATFNATGGTLVIRNMIYRFGKASEGAGFNQGTCTLEVGSVGSILTMGVGNSTNAMDYTAGSGATIDIDISGASSYDVISQWVDNSSGDNYVNLNGATMQIDLGYTPVQGQTFNVWTYNATGLSTPGHLHGSGTVVGLPTGWSQAWVDLSGDGINDTLQLTVPEPATIALLGLGLFAIRRNKK